MAEALQEGNPSESQDRIRLIALGLFFGGLFVLALGAGLFFFKSNSSSDEIQIISAGDQEVNQPSSKQIVVHADGAVNKPGVYDVPTGSRVTDVIEAAGGLTDDADQTKINLAAKVADGQKIYIPARGEVTSDKSQVISQNTNLISINSASQIELESLPGVGPVTAQKIIASRPYSVLEELLSRKVVNKSVWEKIKDLITY